MSTAEENAELPAPRILVRSRRSPKWGERTEEETGKLHSRHYHFTWKLYIFQKLHRGGVWLNSLSCTFYSTCFSSLFFHPLTSSVWPIFPSFCPFPLVILPLPSCHFAPSFVSASHFFLSHLSLQAALHPLIIFFILVLLSFPSSESFCSSCHFCLIIQSFPLHVITFYPTFLSLPYYQLLISLPSPYSISFTLLSASPFPPHIPSVTLTFAFCPVLILQFLHHFPLHSLLFYRSFPS